jgi:prolyl-tRNA synthetase
MAQGDKTENAISPTRSEDYAEWYQQVVKAADLADVSPVRGCMVIKPWGYGLWENIQRELDQMIKDTGHENAYFPIFIPLSFLEKEAAHVDGFAKECAVVTHHRLEAKNGRLVPAGPLEEPLIVRPTSETIIGDSFAKWVQSYRDLPVLINQWANVVRWEMRTRVFLRTSEFLWQEGHTAHATEKEAREETLKMLGVYKTLIEDYLAIPVITGEKPAFERFPGAVDSYTCEAMMQDRKALQAGTSHYLGQNFAKASGIKFLNQSGTEEFAYTTSWGSSTRLIGGMIMAHSDDDGLRIPPKIAPKHVVILPVTPKPESAGAILAASNKLATELKGVSFGSRALACHVDSRDIRGGEKNWQWIKRGVPVRIEIGPRDLESGNIVIMRRDRGHKEKEIIPMSAAAKRIPEILNEMQQGMFSAAQKHRDANIFEDIKTFKELTEFFTPKNAEKPEIHGGFVRAKLADDPTISDKLAELKLTVRCLPTDQSNTPGICVVTGKPATRDAIIAKAY